MNFASTTNTGSNYTENQDFYGDKACEKGHVFVVCDGLSALPMGALASRLAVESILSSFSQIDKQDIKSIIYSSFKVCNEKIINTSNKNIGTTIAMLYLNDNCAYAAWCGDSRI